MAHLLTLFYMSYPSHFYSQLCKWPTSSSCFTCDTIYSHVNDPPPPPCFTCHTLYSHVNDPPPHPVIHVISLTLTCVNDPPPHPVLHVISLTLSHVNDEFYMSHPLHCEAFKVKNVAAKCTTAMTKTDLQQQVSNSGATPSVMATYLLPMAVHCLDSVLIQEAAQGIHVHHVSATGHIHHISATGQICFCFSVCQNTQ